MIVGWAPQPRRSTDVARGLISETLTRVRVDRFRRSPEFEAEVARALNEALGQTLAAPLDVARMKCSDPQAAAVVRAVWDEVVARLRDLPEQAQPQRMRLEPARAPAPMPDPAPPPEPSSERHLFEVGILTDAAPGSPAKRLETLVDDGHATVSAGSDEAGRPVLIYAVREGAVTPALEPLRKP